MILIYLCHTLCHALFSTIKQTRSAQWNTADFLPFFLAHFQSLFLLFFGLSLLPQLATHENLCCLCVFFHPGQPLALAQVLQRQCAQCQAHTAAGTARFYLSPLSLCVAHHLIYWSRCLSPLLPFYLLTYLPHSQQWLTHNLISQSECLCFDNTAEVYRFTPCTANTHIHQFISFSQFFLPVSSNRPFDCLICSLPRLIGDHKLNCHKEGKREREKMANRRVRGRGRARQQKWKKTSASVAAAVEYQNLGGLPCTLCLDHHLIIHNIFLISLNCFPSISCISSRWGGEKLLRWLPSLHITQASPPSECECGTWS